MSQARSGRFEVRYSFPRVSGDEPAACDQVSQVAEFSPRERG